MSVGKLVVVVALVGGAVFLAAHLSSPPSDQDGAGAGPAGFQPPSRPRRDKIPFTKSSECRECHPDVYAEWHGSHHRMAYTNPEVQKLSTGFQGSGVDCLPCHLPRPMFQEGFGLRPLERLDRRAEGVDCFTCHYYEKGNQMLTGGPLGASAVNAPCQPAETPSMRSLQLCAPCHNQHKVHEEWKQSRFAVKGDGYQDCNDCHMPEVERDRSAGGLRKGRSHAFPAAHDKGILQSSATVVSSWSADTLRISVANTGTGHNLPSDERHRAVDLQLILDVGDGRHHEVRVDRFRNPYRQEFEMTNPLPAPGDTYDKTELIPTLNAAINVHAKRIAADFNPIRKIWYPASTQIAAGEKREYRIELPEGVKKLTVRLWYRANPFQEDKDSVLIHEKSLPE